jgi:hypothetical protein
MNAIFGSAALAGASIIPNAVPATALAPLPSVDDARPELRDAFRALEAAYGALQEAGTASRAAWDQYAA